MKFILVGVLLFILYRMMFKSSDTNVPPQNEYMEPPPIQEPDSEGFVDYEELE